MQAPAVGMWDAGFDYVRLTSKWRQEDDSTSILYRVAAGSLLAMHEDAGIPWKPWAWQGYTGKTGPHVQYGSGHNGHIFQASGWAANEARTMVLPFDNAPRVDIAVTIWYETDGCDTIAHHANVSRRFSANKGAVGWKVSLIDSGEHGKTAYIGARTSDIFIRVYDKWRQKGKDDALRYAIRYECELAGDAAKEVWTGSHTTAPGRDWCASQVRAICARRGVFLPRVEAAPVAQAPARREIKTDKERRLAWLRNQVAPTVDKLLTDGVDRFTILKELGLM